MSRFLLALQVWWRTLVDPEFGRQVAALLAGGPSAPAGTTPPVPTPPKHESAQTRQPIPQKPPEAPKRPPRSEALTLLATLQREARLIDFLKESIGEYSDAQIGAAVRDIHRDSANVLERLFKIQPIENEEEGAEVRVPAEADRFRLIGTVRGEPPHRGRLVHHGWEAAKCEVPEWSGTAAASKVIAPAEVELLA